MMEKASSTSVVDGALAVARRPLDTPLLLVGVRCTVRYVVLPFVLPLLGVATGAVAGIALGVLVILDVIAVSSIIITLRWLWRHRHPRRWHYVPLALALATLIVLFLMNNIRVLFA